MTNDDSTLKNFSPSAQSDTENPDNEIIALEGKGSQQEINAKNRARNPDRNQLPGVDL